MPFREASWGVGWSFTLPQPGTLTLRGGLVSQLPALLAALRPPAAQPLEKLFLSDQRADEGAAPAAAALRQLRQLAPHLEHVCELEACNSASSAVLEPLLLQLPRLKTLRLDGCRLSALPAEPYLSGAVRKADGPDYLADEHLVGIQLVAVFASCRSARV